MTLVQFRLNLLFLWHSWAHLQISLKSANGANRFIKDWWASYFVSPHTKNYGIFRKIAATTEYSSSNGSAACWEGLIWPGYNRPNCSLMSVMTGLSHWATGGGSVASWIFLERDFAIVYIVRVFQAIYFQQKQLIFRSGSWSVRRRWES